jgi:hypothetical protein
LQDLLFALKIIGVCTSSFCVGECGSLPHSWEISGKETFARRYNTHCGDQIVLHRALNQIAFDPDWRPNQIIRRIDVQDDHRGIGSLHAKPSPPGH